MSATRVSIVRRLLNDGRRSALLALLAFATLAQVVSTAGAQPPWCGNKTADYVCKLHGAATVGPAGGAAQLRRGVATLLAPQTDLTVFKGGETRITYGTLATCSFGDTRRKTSIRSRFEDALLRFDRGVGSCRFPKGTRRRVGLACTDKCPILLDQSGIKIRLSSSVRNRVSSSGRNRLRQASAETSTGESTTTGEPTTVHYEQHITVDLCGGTATLYVLQPDGTFKPTVFRVRRGERKRVTIDALSTLSSSSTSTTSPTGSASAQAGGHAGGFVVAEEDFGTPGFCAKLPF